jgi:hypothetical protein
MDFDSKRFCGFVASARSGKLEAFGITKGTPVEETLEACAVLGIDHDTIMSLSAVTSPLSKARGVPVFESADGIRWVEKAKHSRRHPATGKFVPADERDPLGRTAAPDPSATSSKPSSPWVDRTPSVEKHGNGLGHWGPSGG